MVKILLSCASGLSSGILANKMQQIANQKQIDARIKAIGISSIRNEVGNFDVLLLGPYIIKTEVEKVVKNQGIVASLDLKDYYQIDSSKMLSSALRLYQINQ